MTEQHWWTPARQAQPWTDGQVLQAPHDTGAAGAPLNRHQRQPGLSASLTLAPYRRSSAAMPPASVVPPCPPEVGQLLAGLGYDAAALVDLERLAAALVQAQKTLNLVAPDSVPPLWQRHLLDSAQLLPVLRTLPAKHWVDLGSGGGFPLLVLGIGLKRWAHDNACDRAAATTSKGRPPVDEGPNSLPLHGIESDQRKVAFLRLTASRLGLALRVWPQRIETVPPFSQAVFTARALANLHQLLGWVHRLGGDGAKAVLLKGRRWQEEVTQAQQRWGFRCDDRPSLSDPQARLLVIEDLHRRQ